MTDLLTTKEQRAEWAALAAAIDDANDGQAIMVASMKYDRAARKALPALISDIDTQATRIAELEAEVERLNWMLGLDQASPLYSIMLEQCETWARWRDQMAKQTKETIERNVYESRARTALGDDNG